MSWRVNDVYFMSLIMDSGSGRKSVSKEKGEVGKNRKEKILPPRHD